MSTEKSNATTTITEHEAGQIERANAAGATPVMFVHGLYRCPAAGTAGPRCSRPPGTWR